MQSLRHFGISAILILVLANSIQGKSIVEFLNLDDAAKLKFITLGAGCLAQHNPSDALIDDLTNLKFTEDKKVKCYVHCIMNGFGVYDDGTRKFDMNKMNGIMFEKDRKMAESCIKEASGADTCDDVYKFYKCAMVHFHA